MLDVRVFSLVRRLVLCFLCRLRFFAAKKSVFIRVHPWLTPSEL